MNKLPQYWSNCCKGIAIKLFDEKRLSNTNSSSAPSMCIKKPSIAVDQQL